MARLCFVTVCMGRLAFLKQTLGQMVRQPECACVVVDYSCPEQSGDWAEATFPGVRVARLPGMMHINKSIARNAGARLAAEPWLCFIDSDILLPDHFAPAVLPSLQPGHFYRPDPLTEKGIWGTFLVAREDFVRAGGYDELFEAYGDEDVDMYDALRFAGVKEATFPSELLTHLPHGDDLRVVRHALRNAEVGHLANRVYRTIKWDLARMQGRVPPADVLGRLYRLACEKVSAAWHGTNNEELELHVEVPDIRYGWRLVREITYRFCRRDPGQ